MLCASTFGAVIGSFRTSNMAVDAAEVRVVTRKTWTTWKPKYAVCV